MILSMGPTFFVISLLPLALEAHFFATPCQEQYSLVVATSHGRQPTSLDIEHQALITLQLPQFVLQTVGQMPPPRALHT